MIYEILEDFLEFLLDAQGAFRVLLGFFNTISYIRGENGLEKPSSIMKLNNHSC